MQRTRETVLRAAIVLAVTASVAAADVDLAVQNGDRILGTLDPTGEVEVYRVTVPAGTTISAKAKAAKGGPPLRVRILDPGGDDLFDASAPKSIKVSGLAAASGTYAIEVQRASGAGAATGDYSLVVAWKSPKSFAATVPVASGSIGELRFAFDAGASLTFTVKPARRSKATPVLTEVGTPDPLHPFDLPSGTTATLVLSTAGDHVFRFVNTSPEAGDVIASVKVKAVKPLKRMLRLTGGVAPGDAQLLALSFVGPEGGIVAAPATSLVAGASCDVPAGALAAPTSLLVGASATVQTIDPGRAAGPAVFFGPEGLTFAAPSVPRITLPYDPAMFPVDTSLLRVFTRDAAGVVTLVSNLTIDAVAHTVSFPAPHFSSFQVFRRFPISENPSQPLPQALTSEERFGTAVAVDGDVVAVGVPDAKVSGLSGAGRLDIFRRTGGLYALETSLALGTPALSEGFGRSVAVDKTTIVVGAPGRIAGNGVRRGAAYIVKFSGGTWTRTTELVPATSAEGDLFGFDVALSSGTALVGAPHDSGEGFGVGAVSVFFDPGANTWFEQARLVPDLAGGPECFGASVAIEGDVAVVGAPGTSATQGAVYLFARTAGWSFADAFTTPSSSTTGQFGHQVAIDGGQVAVGAFADDSLEPLAGAVFVYAVDDGPAALLATLRSDDGAASESPEGDAFGMSLAMRNGLVVVGAPSREFEQPGDPLNSAGQVFVFERTGGAFQRVARLLGSVSTSVPQRFGLFGVALAFDGTTIVVGVPEHDAGSLQHPGQVLTFDVGN